MLCCGSGIFWPWSNSFLITYIFPLENLQNALKVLQQSHYLHLKFASCFIGLVKGQDTEPEWPDKLDPDWPEKLDPDPDKIISDPQFHNIAGGLDESNASREHIPLQNLQKQTCDLSTIV
jgi:hypothetical protein